MNERDFVYWLQGYLELSNTQFLSSEQVKIIQDHLSLVLYKTTPQYNTTTTTSSGIYGLQYPLMVTSC